MYCGDMCFPTANVLQQCLNTLIVFFRAIFGFSIYIDVHLNLHPVCFYFSFTTYIPILRSSKRLLSMMDLRKDSMNAPRLSIAVPPLFVALLRTATMQNTPNSSKLSVLKVKYQSSPSMMERSSVLCAVLPSLMKKVQLRRQ